MIVRTSDFATGKPWPPFQEGVRLRAYRDFRRWYQGDHRTLEPGNRIPVHWFRRVSEVWAELLFASPPMLSHPVARVSEWLDAMAPGLMLAMFDAAVNVSRYGTGVVRVDMDPSMQVVFSSVDPETYFPVVEAWAHGVRVGEVLAYPYTNEPMTQGDPPDRLRLVVHQFDTGEVVETIRQLDGHGGVIGPVVGGEGSRPGPRYPLMATVANGHTEGFWGESDYVALAPLVREMEIRYASAGKVLDRHSDPHLALPESSIEKNAKGEIEMEGGKSQVFAMAPDEPPPAYVTWDADMEASREQAAAMQDLIFAMTGLSAAMFSGRKNLGTIESGVALRSRYLATHLKLEGLRRRAEVAIRQVLVAAADEQARLGGEVVSFMGGEIEFQWEDVFPGEDKESALGAEPANPDAQAGGEPAAG